MACYTFTMSTAYKGIALGVLIAVVVGGWLFRTSAPAEPLSEESPTVYESVAYNLAFSLPQRYVLEERDVVGDDERIHHIITFTHEEDLPPPEGGEGPPSITVGIYQNNSDAQSADSWIRNTSASNFTLGDGVIRDSTLGGMPARSYRWSGLYEGSTVVYATDRFVYTFTVTYLEMGDPIVQDFAALRESVRILPESLAGLTEEGARATAEKACVKGGEALGEGFFNEVTRTWWFDANLNATRPGCNPACVVHAGTGAAEINWRCTGLLPSAQ